MHRLTQDILFSSSYRHEFYEELIPFEIAKKKLRHRYDMVAHLGDVLCTYDMQEILGVCLLRRHFELRPGEQLIKRMSPGHDEATVCAQPAKQDAQGYLWRLYPHHDALAYVPIEAITSDGPAAQATPTFAELIARHPSFFIDFAQASAKLQTSHIFGLALLPASILALEERQAQLERPDHDARERRITTTTPDELDPFEVTETLWTFEPEVRCKIYCEDKPKLELPLDA